MKIGLYPGTFDPIHTGHLAFAKTAVERVGLEKVVIIAEKKPYRKKPHASWDHRQAMIERATEKIEAVDHDYKFANELAHQHTMQNMLAVAKKHFGEQNEFWFLVGSDIFEHMGEWKDVVRTSDYGGFVVALKHDHTKQWLEEKLAVLKQQGFVCHAILVDHKQSGASSSVVREAMNNNKHAKESITEVAHYAKQHQLYQEVASASSAGASSGEGS